MGQYEELFQEESAYLKQVTSFLKEQIELSGGHVKHQKNNLLALRKEMWSEGSKHADEFDRAIELNQYMAMEAIESSQYKHKVEKLRRYENIVEKPYFGRFDFAEEDESVEKIYIGYSNIMDDDTYEVLVYDWRAPIASIFYRNEIGKASYTAPCGQIKGEVFLKRQYEIKKGILEYFFDCSITITDEILQQALGKNASTKMKNIVETIQKEQDQIIRNRENDLLIVQGVAGSGKTSIAMHRIAFLLFDRLEEGLTHNNIAIISPNNLFGEYISDVLPELGEQNVLHLTLEEIFEQYFGDSLRIDSRMSQLEHVINHKQRSKIRKNIEFKGSNEFIIILDRLLEYFERKMIPFENLYYDGRLIENKQLLKNQFLNNKIKLPIAKRLNRIEQMMLDRLEPLHQEKRKFIETYLEQKGGYEFEEENRSKYLINKQKQGILNTLRKFTKVDIIKLYERLFKDEVLFNQLSRGLKLPKEMKSIRMCTLKGIESESIPYEDGIALLYLKLKIEGSSIYTSIKQVLIDEAQDYYPMHYKVFGEIFKSAHYTVLGDVCQTIEKANDETLYEEIIHLLGAKKALKLSLTKSYRSSYEINEFNQNLRGDYAQYIAVERHDQKPVISACTDEKDLQNKILEQIKQYKSSGYETITILCKTNQQARQVHKALREYLEIKLVSEEDTYLAKGILIMPIYMAKGLEYDAVIVYDVNNVNYYNRFDKQLLYIAGTRALHRLALFYVGEISKFLIAI